MLTRFFTTGIVLSMCIAFTAETAEAVRRCKRYYQRRAASCCSSSGVAQSPAARVSPTLPAVVETATLSSPVSAKEQEMFDKMYGELDISEEERELLEDDWKSMPSAQRQADYANFMAGSVQEDAKDAGVTSSSAESGK